MQYQPETLDMIYQMVHKERKTIDQIAKLFAAYPSRIQDIYNQAMQQKNKLSKSIQQQIHYQPQTATA